MTANAAGSRRARADGTASRAASTARAARAGTARSSCAAHRWHRRTRATAAVSAAGTMRRTSVSAFRPNIIGAPTTQLQRQLPGGLPQRGVGGRVDPARDGQGDVRTVGRRPVPRLARQPGLGERTPSPGGWRRRCLGRTATRRSAPSVTRLFTHRASNASALTAANSLGGRDPSAGGQHRAHRGQPARTPAVARLDGPRALRATRRSPGRRTTLVRGKRFHRERGVVEGAEARPRTTTRTGALRSPPGRAASPRRRRPDQQPAGALDHDEAAGRSTGAIRSTSSVRVGSGSPRPVRGGVRRERLGIAPPRHQRRDAGRAGHLREVVVAVRGAGLHRLAHRDVEARQPGMARQCGGRDRLADAGVRAGDETTLTARAVARTSVSTRCANARSRRRSARRARSAAAATSLRARSAAGSTRPGRRGPGTRSPRPAPPPARRG